MRLIQLKTPTESEINGIYTYVLETYLNKLLSELGMTLFMLRSIVDQVRQHHSVSNVEILQQSIKVVLAPDDVFI